MEFYVNFFLGLLVGWFIIAPHLIEWIETRFLK